MIKYTTTGRNNLDIFVVLLKNRFFQENSFRIQTVFSSFFTSSRIRNKPYQLIFELSKQHAMNSIKKFIRSNRFNILRELELSILFFLPNVLDAPWIPNERIEERPEFGRRKPEKIPYLSPLIEAHR